MKNRYLGPFVQKHFFAGVFFAFIFFPNVAFAIPIFISEIHYDNAGADTGEAVEIAGPAGSDLSAWQLVLYNGSGGLVYNTTALSGIIPNQQSGFGTLFYPVVGIQNGVPDGLALIDAGSAVVQFLSYEGSFIAGDGPAIGMTSTSIGVLESSATPIGHSLQLGGSGAVYADFSWQVAGPETFGSVNANQRFQVASVPEADALVLMGLGLFSFGLIQVFRQGSDPA